jgi:hypothetical protein
MTNEQISARAEHCFRSGAEFDHDKACYVNGATWMRDELTKSELREVKRATAKILREGFERGAQWAIMDHAYRMGNGFAVVGKDGAVPDEERDAHVAQILADLFVPKIANK